MNKFATLSIAAGLLLTSCSSTMTESRQERDSQSYTKPDAGPMQISRVMKSKMYVAVGVLEHGDLKAGKKVSASIQGRLAAAGFGINSDKQSFAKVGISAIESKTIGGFGDSRRVKLTTEVSVRRLDNKLLGRQNFSVTGKRSSSALDAMNAASRELSTEISDWVEQLCTSASNGMNAAVVNIDLSDYKDYLFGNSHRAKDKAMSISRFTSLANEHRGIFDCQLIEARGDIYTFRVIYLTENFPNGLTSRSVRSHDVKIDENNPLKSLAAVIFASAN